MTQVY